MIKDIINIILCLFLLFIIHKLDESNKGLRNEVKECKKIMNYQLENIKEKNSVIKEFYNYTTRTQLLIGVDTIDNVFTFEERLKNPINVRNILRCVKP